MYDIALLILCCMGDKWLKAALAVLYCFVKPQANDLFDKDVLPVVIALTLVLLHYTVVLYLQKIFVLKFNMSALVLNFFLPKLDCS